MKDGNATLYRFAKDYATDSDTVSFASAFSVSGETNLGFGYTSQCNDSTCLSTFASKICCGYVLSPVRCVGNSS